MGARQNPRSLTREYFGSEGLVHLGFEAFSLDRGFAWLALEHVEGNAPDDGEVEGGIGIERGYIVARLGGAGAGFLDCSRRGDGNDAAQSGPIRMLLPEPADVAGDIGRALLDAAMSGFGLTVHKATAAQVCAVEEAPPFNPNQIRYG